jgi:aryl-alcohol dehydrogenase-like predicted oxidoreductase
MDTASPDSTPELGLGCWPLGGDEWGSQDDRVSIATIEAAFERGIRHFDTAQSYGPAAHGEDLLGRALGSARSNAFIATKMVYLPAKKVEGAIASSLRRLHTDYVDLLYIHWPKKGGDLGAMMEAFERARASGKIRRIGVSNFSVGRMREVMNSGRLDAVQLCYNLLWRREERETMPFCRANGISMITYGSLAEGILTGKFGPGPQFAPGDHRADGLLFDKTVWTDVRAAVAQMKSVAHEAGRPLAHCALRWLLSRPGVRTVLVGCRTPLQLRENVAALEGEIDPPFFEKLTGISDALAGKLPDEGNVFRWYP